MGLWVMKIIWVGAIYRGVIHRENLTGDSLGEFSCYRFTVLCDWFSSLISRREKLLKEEIDTSKEANVILTICSENDYKNNREQPL